MEIWFDRILPGIARILIYVSLGVFVGSLLNSLGWLRHFSFLSTPFRKTSHLPPQCCTAFVTAFASPRAANGILAGAFEQKLITRNQMIVGAVGNTFPNTLAHLRVMAFAIIPLAGYAGAAYVGFQLMAGVGCSFVALLFGRFFICAEDSLLECVGKVESTVVFRVALGKAFKHTKRILRRVVIITLPLYILVVYLDQMGVFTKMTEALPQVLTDVLPPASVAVLVGHMTNIVTAASTASELLKSQALNAPQLFLTFLVGYGLTVPIRAMRHSIPAAVGIFPPKAGMMIVVISSGLRLVFTVVAIIITIALIKGGAFL